MPRMYNTKQKDEIAAAIDSFDDRHFTAEDICEYVREKGIGPSTVYRHLDKLVKDGSLQKYVSEVGESACYRKKGECGEHFHLRCTVCGKLEHLSCMHLDGISSHVESEHGFKIDPSRTVFYGICRECASK